MSFFPKAVNFFELFEKAARNVLEGARLLEDFFYHPGNSEEKLQKIHDVEHVGDQITHDTMEKLYQTFITPIDREDIHALVSELDNVLDLIYGTAKRAVIYNVSPPGPEVREVVKILVRAVEEVVEAVSYLREMKRTEKILAQCIVISRLEREADEALRLAISNLLENEKDAILVIKRKEILETLESATDCCDNVANVLEGIALKNA